VDEEPGLEPINYLVARLELAGLGREPIDGRRLRSLTEG
jgi:hypothetical protein